MPICAPVDLCHALFSLLFLVGCALKVGHASARFSLPARFALTLARAVPAYEITVLIPIFNKAHYFDLSFPSIFKLPIDSTRLCVLCYDDGSTDNSVQRIREYQRLHPSITLIEGGVNRGTLYARIRLIEETKTRWLVFLDPDDQFYGSGMVEALAVINQTGADIVQFGCRQVYHRFGRSQRCWREPRQISVLDAFHLRKFWLKGFVDVHLHRKVWRTELFQQAVRSIPQDLRQKRILRCQDVLLYGHVLLLMKGLYRYLPTLGEMRFVGWPDNSQSSAYQARKLTSLNEEFVMNWSVAHFGRRIQPG
jgi:glycosyltransferase involved in cell wall biosynthesis